MEYENRKRKTKKILRIVEDGIGREEMEERKDDKTRRRRKRNTRLLPDPYRPRELQTQSL
jgi:hypothetical protein